MAARGSAVLTAADSCEPPSSTYCTSFLLFLHPASEPNAATVSTALALVCAPAPAYAQLPPLEAARAGAHPSTVAHGEVLRFARTFAAARDGDRLLLVDRAEARGGARGECEGEGGDGGQAEQAAGQVRAHGVLPDRDGPVRPPRWIVSGTTVGIAG